MSALPLLYLVLFIFGHVASEKCLQQNKHYDANGLEKEINSEKPLEVDCESGICRAFKHDQGEKGFLQFYCSFLMYSMRQDLK